MSLHSSHLTHLHKRELDELYGSVFLRGFSRFAISIFIPIYLLQQHFGLKEVFVFEIVFFVLMDIAYVVAMHSNMRLGVKKTMFVGNVLSVISFLALIGIQHGLGYLWAATLLGFASGIYWGGYHIEYIHAVKKGLEGRTLGVIKGALIVLASVSPLVGAILITKFSYTATFLSVAVVELVSIGPLFFSKDFRLPKGSIDLLKSLTIDTKRKATTYWAYGVVWTATEIVWPVFIFQLVDNVLEVGWIVAVSTFAVAIILVGFGRFADRATIRSYKLGVVAAAISWPLRLALAFAPGGFGLYFANIYSGLSYNVLDIALEKVVYARARVTESLADYFLFREWYISVGRISLLAIGVFIPNIPVLFIIALMATFVYFVLVKEMRAEAFS